MFQNFDVDIQYFVYVQSTIFFPYTIKKVKKNKQINLETAIFQYK